MTREVKLALELFDRGIEIERIASMVGISTTAVRTAVWIYRKLTA